MDKFSKLLNSVEKFQKYEKEGNLKRGEKPKLRSQIQKFIDGTLTNHFINPSSSTPPLTPRQRHQLFKVTYSHPTTPTIRRFRDVMAKKAQDAIDQEGTPEVILKKLSQTLPFNQIDSEAPPPLANLGSSCYTNAIIQMLYSIIPLRKVLVNVEVTPENWNEQPSLVALYMKLMQEGKTSKRDLRSRVSDNFPPQFSCSVESDAFEMLVQSFLTFMTPDSSGTHTRLPHQDTPQPLNMQVTEDLHRLFQFEEVLQSWCPGELSLGERSTRKFLPNLSLDDFGDSIQELVNHYTRPILLESPFDEKCPNLTVTKRTPHHFGPFLIIYLKRVVHPDKKVRANLDLTIGVSKFVLRGFVKHSGSRTKGHYTYYKRVLPGNTWFMASDSQVDRLIAPEALQASENGVIFLYQSVYSAEERLTPELAEKQDDEEEAEEVEEVEEDEEDAEEVEEVEEDEEDADEDEEDAEEVEEDEDDADEDEEDAEEEDEDVEEEDEDVEEAEQVEEEDEGEETDEDDDEEEDEETEEAEDDDDDKEDDVDVDLTVQEIMNDPVKCYLNPNRPCASTSRAKNRYTHRELVSIALSCGIFGASRYTIKDLCRLLANERGRGNPYLAKRGFLVPSLFQENLVKLEVQLSAVLTDPYNWPLLQETLADLLPLPREFYFIETVGKISKYLYPATLAQTLRDKSSEILKVLNLTTQLQPQPEVTDSFLRHSQCQVAYRIVAYEYMVRGRNESSKWDEVCPKVSTIIDTYLVPFCSQGACQVPSS